ncbi:sigma-70 family RNA polymerase sigma factor [Streptomyces sp. NPDC058758]|uniref:sigma-70 family RNA polymerase sigma factor n=1 Tax=Streptomyces sp. NPDC058758 TaxID=3346627 RepID=UPI0036A4EF50
MECGEGGPWTAHRRTPGTRPVGGHGSRGAVTHETTASESSKRYCAEAYRAENRKLLGYTMKNFRIDIQDAEEILSGLVLEALKRDFESADAVARFLWSRIKNRAIDDYRSRLTRDRLREAAEEACVIEQDDSGPRPDGNPEPFVLRHLHAVDVLARLTEQDRLHVVLVRHGYTPQECAEQLGIEPGTERVRRHRLLAKIEKANAGGEA